MRRLTYLLRAELDLIDEDQLLEQAKEHAAEMPAGTKTDTVHDALRTLFIACDHELLEEPGAFGLRAHLISVILSTHAEKSPDWLDDPFPGLPMNSVICRLDTGYALDAQRYDKDLLLDAWKVRCK
ncbi:hypothetical protein ACFZAV_39915 [Streptomyces sp. NPDC008343]|uniref:hypothetical protein n=1 Tax=Streptomyces sp. NPDC008343 TaxID=3364828 RepID=UPI0036E8A313